tara:strand:- start:1034 stop:1297 length:264 start_codon:yes stop_codon:yes gene_type:complete
MVSVWWFFPSFNLGVYVFALCFHVIFWEGFFTGGWDMPNDAYLNENKWIAPLLFVTEPWIMLIQVVLGGLLFYVFGGLLTGGLSFFG